MSLYFRTYKGGKTDLDCLKLWSKVTCLDNPSKSLILKVTILSNKNTAFIAGNIATTDQYQKYQDYVYVYIKS